jgi:hypothetical protein
MLACVALHIWAMFPDYPGLPPTPVASLPHDVAMFICLEAGWALAATLVLTRISVAGGVAVGAGLGLVEVGLLLADLISGFEVGKPGAPGGWMAMGGLGLGLAGVLLAASAAPMGAPHPLANPFYVARAIATLPVTVLAVITFWLSWQTGQVVYTSGPPGIIDGDTFAFSVGPLTASLLAGLAIGLVALAAAYWTPPGVGAWALVGVAIAMVSQLVTALVEVLEPLSDAVHQGVSAGLDPARSSVSLTADWGATVAAVIALVGLAAWAALDGRRTASAGAPLTAVGRPGPEEGSHDEAWPAGHRWPGSGS